MRKLIVMVLILVLLGVPSYWVYTDKFPNFIKETKVGKVLEDLSWKLNTILAQKSGEKPEEVVEAFYQALQEDNYYATENFIDPESIEYLNGDLLRGTSFPIKEYSITKVEINRNKSRIKTIVNGDRAQSFMLMKNQTSKKWGVIDYGDDFDVELP